MEYYNLLKATLEEHGLMNLPSRIYNMDESGMLLEHKPPKVVACKGVKRKCIAVHLETKGRSPYSLVPMLLDLFSHRWSSLKASGSTLTGARVRFLTPCMECLNEDGPTRNYFSIG